MVRGQCIGGMIQGLGTALCEGYIYDEQGHLLNPSFTDNKIPTAKDLPEVVESMSWRRRSSTARSARAASASTR